MPRCLTFPNVGALKYTLFADASRYGTPPIKALFYEFPNEPELFTVDKQFMIGNVLLVTPVLHPNVTTVKGLKASPFHSAPHGHDRLFPWHGVPRVA